MKGGQNGLQLVSGKATLDLVYWVYRGTKWHT
jgi:hypothetical protein